jgi:hypothetical protein
MSETFAFAGDYAGFESKRLLATGPSGRRFAILDLGACDRDLHHRRVGKTS